MKITEEEAAAQAIASLDTLSPAQELAISEITTLLQDHDDPFVDIHHLFSLFNTIYFCGLLEPTVNVSWSERLTLCAGICELVRDKQKQKLIRLKLSSALLQYRPRSDVVDTLLHEAIHAYLFITSSHVRSDDPSGHGIGFQMLASFINTFSKGLALNHDITIYHEFDAEVDSFRTHIWQCNGPCRDKAPFFGLVKRAMNRPPGKNDSWFHKHTAECGGTFVKIKEPKMTKQALAKLSAKERSGRQQNKLDSWLNHDHEIMGNPSAASGVESSNGLGEKFTVGDNEILKPGLTQSYLGGPELKNELDTPVEKQLVACPVCDEALPLDQADRHLTLVHLI
jgi:hypothetical protein